MDRIEALLANNNNVLVVDNVQSIDTALRSDFLGSVVSCQDASGAQSAVRHKTVYLAGDISKMPQLEAERVLIVRELSQEYEHDGNHQIVSVGQLPLNVHGFGVYYRRFFDPNVPMHDHIRAEHTFQSLTESTKPGTALRTGIYLTPVEQDNDGLHFRLLRCSTNLSGPTDNFRATDHVIVDALNIEAAWLFHDQAQLNHVLAQVYGNTRAATTTRQIKAKISAHADKTKDMPAHGIMAFCTFYNHVEKLKPLPQDPYDLGLNGVSGLTKLRFRLKEQGTKHHRMLPREFALTLYPHSVFFMPLSTNRLYTHEIQSSMLDVERLPTRMGYVVRCSSTEAVHQGGQTFIKNKGKLVQLEPPTLDGMAELRKLYAEENKSTAFLDYEGRFSFSMNQGDYAAPIF
jgi:hypothetical protein